MSQLSAFLQALRPHVAGDLYSDEATRLLYSTDASLYQVMPLAVLRPRTADDVTAAVATAAAHGIPMLPRGGGTSLAGQAVNAALVLDFSRYMDGILELNTEEGWVRVQPGLVLDHLNSALRPHGLLFGPDPASSNRATLGGMVGNNSTGSHSILYGMMADHVHAANVVLSDGSAAAFAPLDTTQLAERQRRGGLEGAIYRQFNALVWDPANREAIRRGTPRHWRRCGGYDLARFVQDGTIDFHLPTDGRFNLASLMTGSEGTLGVLTELTLRLAKRPSHTALAIVTFAELKAALAAVSAILEVAPSAVELFDRLTLELAAQVPQYGRLMRTFVDGSPHCLLVTEFYGANERELAQKLAQLQEHLARRRVGATAVTAITTAAGQAAVWQVRKGGQGLLMSLKSDYKPIAFIEDTAVPVEHLADYIPKVEALCAELGTEITYYAHASAGCLHIRPLINTKLGEEVDKIPQIQKGVMALLHQYGGAFSSEHGDGRARSWLNRAFFGDELYALFCQTKAIFDPHNLFNPGNIVEAAAPGAHLRLGPSYQAVPPPVALDFGPGGYSMAVEMCNGAGACRKTASGVMCPSFMLTREERDSTRGRANLLRAALAGQLPLTGSEMAAAMDLCVSCKACKAECPSSVDMARLKAEWLYQQQAAHGVRPRDWLFAHIGLLSRLGSGWHAPLVNWAGSLRLVRWGLARWLGIGRERPLPQFVRRPFEKGQEGQGLGERGRVVLFVDVFSRYSYPDVAAAAVAVLGAAGFEVAVTRAADAGRPAFSKGLLKQARRTANSVLAELAGYAAEGLPIIFLEPSDLSCVADDYAALLPGDERLAAVAVVCCSFEQFVAERAVAFEGLFVAQERRLLLHGHCHERALFGTAAAHRALTLPPNYTLEELDTSCCGMAGSFGYEAEHQSASLQMAERRLLPAVRAAEPNTIIVAPGVSCRQQIGFGSGRAALHPAQVLRDALLS